MNFDQRSDEDHALIIPKGHHRGEQMSLLQRVVYRSAWLVAQVISRTYFRLQVVGLEHVPPSGAFVVAPSHRSNLDTPLSAIIMSRRMRYMGKESLWRSRFGAYTLTAMGGFPVERGTADRTALRACVEVLERGEPLVMFPEGTRQSGPELGPFFDGPAFVASRAGVPILPIGIGGSERAMSKGVKLPRPARLVVVVGPPLDPPSAPEGRSRVPRSAITHKTEQLREAIQELFDRAEVISRGSTR